MKKVITSLAALAMIAGGSLASAASVERSGAAIGDSEELSSTALVLAAFAVVATGIIIVVEGDENDIPASA